MPSNIFEITSFTCSSLTLKVNLLSSVMNLEASVGRCCSHMDQGCLQSTITTTSGLPAITTTVDIQPKRCPGQGTCHSQGSCIPPGNGKIASQTSAIRFNRQTLGFSDFRHLQAVNIQTQNLKMCSYFRRASIHQNEIRWGCWRYLQTRHPDLVHEILLQHVDWHGSGPWPWFNIQKCALPTSVRETCFEGSAFCKT